MFKKKSPATAATHAASHAVPSPQVTACGSTLAAILVSMRAITPSQLDAARAEFNESAQADIMLASTLRSKGFCTLADVSTALKIQKNMLKGDQASVALDLMEARIERFRDKEDVLKDAIEKMGQRLRHERREERREDTGAFNLRLIAAKAV